MPVSGVSNSIFNSVVKFFAYENRKMYFLYNFFCCVISSAKQLCFLRSNIYYLKKELRWVKLILGTGLNSDVLTTQLTYTMTSVQVGSGIKY